MIFRTLELRFGQSRRLLRVFDSAAIRILVCGVFLFLSARSAAQGIYLVKGKKRIPFPSEHWVRAKIGVYTDRDTLVYDESREKGWEVRWSTVDSFQVRRPLRSVDSVVLRNSRRYPDGYEYNKDFKKDGVKYTLVTKVLEYEQRVFAFTEVRKIKYTTYSGNGSGCVGCFFIPVFNVGFLIWAIHRWDAREVEVGEYRRESRIDSRESTIVNSQ